MASLLHNLALLPHLETLLATRHRQRTNNTRPAMHLLLVDTLVVGTRGAGLGREVAGGGVGAGAEGHHFAAGNAGGEGGVADCEGEEEEEGEAGRVHRVVVVLRVCRKVECKQTNWQFIWLPFWETAYA